MQTREENFVAQGRLGAVGNIVKYNSDTLVKKTDKLAPSEYNKMAVVSQGKVLAGGWAARLANCIQRTTSFRHASTRPCAEETPACAEETPPCAEETPSCAEETPACACAMP